MRPVAPERGAEALDRTAATARAFARLRRARPVRA
jgi:hypothetical protein